MKYVISGPSKPIQDTIYLPSSKSISNRVLIIHSLARSGAEIENLSESDDTDVLQHALKDGSPVKDVNHAGTAMRFLTAYFAAAEGNIILTGSDRMKQRPIGPLVDALRELGADIEYKETEGCPPLEITGGTIRGGHISINGGISSQFISALMMIGPVLEGGLHMSLEGELVSTTYINMTLKIMQQCGVGAILNGREISIPQQAYQLDSFKVESDWSAASYWYQVAALLPGSEIVLPWLLENSLQGDAVLAKLFALMGVQTGFKTGKVVLHSGRAALPGRIEYDFIGCPDLVQTCAATLCALRIPFRFTGTRTLRVKETDRITALQEELGRLGYVLDAEPGGEWIAWEGKQCEPESDPVIRTYHDHRMAMAFAPLAIPFGKISIDDPGVVTKSYPGYWDDLVRAGFSIDQI